MQQLLRQRRVRFHQNVKRSNAREAELLQDAPEAHFGQLDPEAVAPDAFEIDAAPAHHTVRLRVRPVFDELLQHLLLIVGQPRSPPGRLDVDQPVRPMLVEPVCFKYGRQHVGATMNPTQRRAAPLITPWERLARRTQWVEPLSSIGLNGPYALELHFNSSSISISHRN